MRISKKILAIALSILMAVSMMPFTVFAEDVPEGTTYSFTNTSGVTTYNTTAFPATLTSDGTYKLYDDVETSNRISVSTFVYNVTIDLNGHSITSTADDASYPGAIYMGRAGKATSHRSFSVINTSSTPATITNTVGDGVCVNGNYNDFYLGENVTMTTKGTGVWVTTKTNDTVTIDGAVVSTEEFGVYVNGTNAGPNTVTVNGSVTGDDAGIYAAGVADYIVNGTVTGDTGIYQKGGNLTVNEGAVVTGTGAATAYAENGNGMTATGDAIVVENNAGYNYGSTTINGGTITSTEAGTSAISTPVASNVASASQEVQDRIDVDVKGGTFTEAGDPADVSEFVNENSELDPTTGVVTHYVAEAGGVKYTSLKDAIAAISAADISKGYKANGTVTLLDDSIGSGLVIAEGSDLTIDFNGKTYDVTNPTVGSPGTETNAFQLLKNSNITFANGTITSSVAKIMLQNYSNLTLDNMTLTLNNPSYSSAYTLSNNNGNIVIDDTTINANPAGGFAFDVCRYASYPSVNVTVTGDSVINGNVEVYASSSDAKDGFSLTLESGTMNGDIVIDSTAAAVMATEETPKKAVVTKAAAFTKDAPEGYEWNESGVLVEDTHSVAEVNGVKYDTFEEALADISTVTSATHSNATDPTYQYKTYVANGTIKLLQDCTANGIIIGSGSNLTIDFNSKTLDITDKPVGSNGTETIGMQLLKDSDITFKNGTLTSTADSSKKIVRLIQNYADLTLDNMTVGMKGNFYDQMTMSNCNGSIAITDSTVSAPDFTWLGWTDEQAAESLGARAMSVGTFSTYTDVDVTVTDSTINGYVNIDNTGANGTAALTLDNSDVNGNIVDESMNGATVTNTGSTVDGIPAGYEWNATTGVLGPIADGFNLSVDDMIHMNLYVNADAYGADEITVTYSDPDLQAGGTKTETFDVADLDKDTQGRYAVKILAAPAQIKDEVTVTAGSHTYTTSVAEYCNALIAADMGEAYTNLATAMLDYGKAASASFDYNTAAFDYDYSTLNLGQNSVLLDASDANGYFTGFAYIAKSVPSLRIYLDTTEEEVVRNGLTATVNGEEAEITVVEGTDKVCVDITGIKAEDLDKAFTINFNGGSLYLNALAYTLNPNNSAAFNKALFNYNKAAEAVFA